MKYKILQALDVSGFTFLSPVVRLCYGEEPRRQLRDIARYIVTPVLALVLFVQVWAWMAPKHKTKSGEVPTPNVVYDAAKGIWRFHVREATKEKAYALTGPRRQQQLQAVQQRLAHLQPLESAAEQSVRQATQQRDQALQIAITPIQQQYQAKQGEFRSFDADRASRLQRDAERLEPGDRQAYDELAGKVAKHLQLLDLENEFLSGIKTQQDEFRTAKYSKLTEARRTQTKIAEERLYLKTLAEQLTVNNRAHRVADAEQRLETAADKYYAAAGADVLPLATRVVKQQQRVATTAESQYARPWTLPNQVLRSLACVFFGFFLGSLIAIPIGVLCGLSDTFMAAMTPFIALLKPVSPIVWLPIALIIVGGFIPDPDKHWLINGLAELPLVGWMKINPAFIASGVTVALCSLWPTLVNTALGVGSIDDDHLNVARVLRLGFLSRLFKIVVPSALPLIFAGLRISLGVGWMVLIAAELLASSEGIGKYVWDQFNNGASDSFAKMFVVVLVVGVIGFLLDRTMIVLQRMVSFDGSVATV